MALSFGSSCTVLQGQCGTIILSDTHCTVSLNLKKGLVTMEAETLPDSTTTAAVVHFAATDGTQSTTATIGMDVDAAFPDLFLSNEQVRNRTPGETV